MISIEDLKKAFAYGKVGIGHKTEQKIPVDDSMWDEMLSEIDKTGRGKINFRQFKGHMQELIE